MTYTCINDLYLAGDNSVIEFDYIDFSEVPYMSTVTNTAPLNYNCENIFNQCSNDLGCNDCTNNVFYWRYILDICPTSGSCMYVELRIPAFYETGTNNYYALSEATIEAALCDSIENGTVLDETILKCTDTTCSNTYSSTADTCQRNNDVSNARLPMIFAVYNQGVANCPTPCGGSETNYCGTGNIKKAHEKMLGNFSFKSDDHLHESGRDPKCPLCTEAYQKALMERMKGEPIIDVTSEFDVPDNVKIFQINDDN